MFLKFYLDFYDKYTVLKIFKVNNLFEQSSSKPKIGLY